MYHAFISYSHAVDNRLAPALQSAVRRFASPWYRRSALRIFRDQTDLSVNPGLWSSIEAALSASKHLVLLASPGAAASRWVRRELEYWLAHNPARTLLIVLTEGTITWNDELKDFDWERSDALPRSLAGAFAEEPLYLDLRSISRTQDIAQDNPPFRDAVASLAAVLLGRPKDELIGDDIAVRRRARWTLWSSAVVLAALTVMLAFSTRFALSQRDSLARSLQVVQGQKLAAESQLIRDRSPNLLQLSALLGLEAMRLAPSAETAAQLRRTASLLLPPLRRLEVAGARGPTEIVSGIAFSPDSRSLVVAGLGPTPRWLDVDTGREVRAFAPAAPGEMGGIAVAFSPDGAQVAMSALNGINVWNTADGRLARHIPPSSGTPRTLTASADGRYLATGSYEGAVLLIERATGRETPLGRHDIIVNTLDFSADSKLLASGSNDNSVRIWSVPDGRQVQLLPHEFGLKSVAFSPDGRQVATAGWEGLARIWDVASGRQVASFDHRGVVNSLAFSADGNRLATGGTDATVRIWDQVTKLEIARAVHDAEVTAVRFAPDGRTLASASERSVTLWATVYGNEVLQLRHPDDIVTSVAISPDGRRLATAASDTARLWNLADGQELFRLKHDSNVDDVVFSADGAALETLTEPRSAAGSETCAVRWDLASRKMIGRMCRGLASMVISADGGRVASVGNGGVLSIEDVTRSGSTIRLRDVDGADFQSVLTLSADHRRIALATDANEEHRLVVNDVGRDSKARIITLDGRANQLVFGIGGSTIAAGTGGGVFLWDVESGRELGRALLSEGVDSVAPSPDGRRLVTGGGDQSVRVWEVPAFVEVARFEMGGSVNRVLFSPDGELVAAASSDRTARVWRWRVDVVADACKRLSRNLSVDEWRTHLGDLPYHATCPELQPPATQSPPEEKATQPRPVSR